MRQTLRVMIAIVVVPAAFGASADRATAALVDRVLLHLDEGTDTTAYDDTLVFQNDGMLGEGGPGTPAWTTGKFGGALQFNPSGGTGASARTVVWCPADPSLNVTSALTLEAWIWRNDDDNPTGYSPVALRGDWGSTGFWLATLQNSGTLWSRINGQTGTANAYSSVSVPAGEWHHVAMTYQSGIGGQLYIDGLPDGTLANVGDIKWVTASKDTRSWPLLLGSDPNPDGYGGHHVMDGLIDEFAMYGYALTPDEILARALGGPPVSVPEPPSFLLLAAGLIGLAARRRKRAATPVV